MRVPKKNFESIKALIEQSSYETGLGGFKSGQLDKENKKIFQNRIPSSHAKVYAYVQEALELKEVVEDEKKETLKDEKYNPQQFEAIKQKITTLLSDKTENFLTRYIQYSIVEYFIAPILIFFGVRAPSTILLNRKILDILNPLALDDFADVLQDLILEHLDERMPPEDKDEKKPLILEDSDEKQLLPLDDAKGDEKSDSKC